MNIADNKDGTVESCVIKCFSSSYSSGDFPAEQQGNHLTGLQLLKHFMTQDSPVMDTVVTILT